MEKIYLDLYGNPEREDSICLRHGYGYFAYTNSNNPFFCELMKNLAIWSGATKKYQTLSGEYYYGYELDCRDRKFLESATFRKICQKAKVELIICDDDMKPLKQFFDSIKR